MRRQPFLTTRLQGFGTTVFTEMTHLAEQHGALNLGQGFPNFDGPDFIKAAAIAAIGHGTPHEASAGVPPSRNQYCRMTGIPELNRAIAHHQQRFYDLTYDPDTEVTVMNGATEAIFATVQALCDVGDEVVMFEPFYDSYPAVVAMAGAQARLITLQSPDFAWDPATLERAISARTRLLLLNTPHNPTGKVFSRTELETIAALCRRHDLLVLSDEVYEHLVFAGEHLPMATLPGMWERTITISSTGKTFSFTGWKIGYACAPAAISAAIRTAHQFITFCNSAPLQPAMALALTADDDFFRDLHAAYRARRDLLCQGLAAAGLGVLPPAGTYFALADIRPMGYDDDVEFCRMLPAAVGVAAIPPTAFYVNKDAGKHLVRFAFCKTLELLAEANRRLQRLPRGKAPAPAT